MKEKNLDRRQNRSNKDGKKQLKILFSVLLLCFMLAGIQACGSSAVPESVKLPVLEHQKQKAQWLIHKKNQEKLLPNPRQSP